MPEGVSAVTIEHWLPRNPDDKIDVGQGLDYKNMFAVCSGRRGCGSEEGMTCDARKGNSEIKVNPLDAKTLSGITYTANGKIKSSDPIIDEDINIRLNLNGETTSLSENRKQVLDSLLRDIKKDVERAIYLCIVNAVWKRSWKWMILKYHMPVF